MANKQLRKDHFRFGYDPLATLDEDHIKVDVNYAFPMAYAFLNDSVYRYLRNKLLGRAPFNVLFELSQMPWVRGVEAVQSAELASMINHYMGKAAGV